MRLIQEKHYTISPSSNKFFACWQQICIIL